MFGCVFDLLAISTNMKKLACPSCGAAPTCLTLLWACLLPHVPPHPLLSPVSPAPVSRPRLNLSADFQRVTFSVHVCIGYMVFQRTFSELPASTFSVPVRAVFFSRILMDSVHFVRFFLKNSNEFGNIHRNSIKNWTPPNEFAIFVHRNWIHPNVFRQMKHIPMF
jgi:hypothetical protein